MALQILIGLASSAINCLGGWIAFASSKFNLTPYNLVGPAACQMNSICEMNYYKIGFRNWINIVQADAFLRNITLHSSIRLNCIHSVPESQQTCR